MYRTVEQMCRKAARLKISQMPFEKGLPTRPLSINEFCEWFGVCRRFVELENERGNLRFRRLSKRKILIMPEDIDRWVDK